MNPSFRTKTVCFVHDWLVTMRGGEKVLETMCELYPNAPIYTLFANRKKLSPALQSKEIHTSFLQLIPGIEKFYRFLLPIFPLAIKTFNLKEYDLVISSSHCVAKSVPVRKSAIHICYCYTPMRYLWEFQEEYLGSFPKIIRKLIHFYFNFLKRWDIKTAKNVNYFLTSSRYVAERILRIYNRRATVINPPAELLGDRQVIAESESSYYLIVSALVPYKRIDLAIEAFNQLKQPLKIVGTGPLMENLKQMIRFEGIQLTGWVSDEQLPEYYENCKALIFPGEEDFGIVPLEAQMCGKPVIAYGKGGVCETVIAYDESSKKGTGIFFDEAIVDSLVRAVQKSQQIHFDPHFIRAHGQKFTKDHFKERISAFIKAPVN